MDKKESRQVENFIIDIYRCRRSNWAMSLRQKNAPYLCTCVLQYRSSLGSLSIRRYKVGGRMRERLKFLWKKRYMEEEQGSKGPANMLVVGRSYSSQADQPTFSLVYDHCFSIIQERMQGRWASGVWHPGCTILRWPVQSELEYAQITVPSSGWPVKEYDLPSPSIWVQGKVPSPCISWMTCANCGFSPHPTPPQAVKDQAEDEDITKANRTSSSRKASMMGRWVDGEEEWAPWCWNNRQLEVT